MWPTYYTYAQTRTIWYDYTEVYLVRAKSVQGSRENWFNRDLSGKSNTGSNEWKTVCEIEREFSTKQIAGDLMDLGNEKFNSPIRRGKAGTLVGQESYRDILL